MVEILTTLDAPAVIDPKARYWLKITIFALVRGRPHRNTAITSGMRKLEWWLADGKKNFEDTFTRFDTILESDRQTDRHSMMADRWTDTA